MFGGGRRSGSDLSFYIGPDALLEGKLYASKGEVHIEGNFKGDVASSGTVVVAEGGSVEGSVKAENLHVYGTIKGTVEVSGHLIVGSKGVVDGDVVYGTLTVEDGGRILGNMKIRSGKKEEKSSRTEGKGGGKAGK